MPERVYGRALTLTHRNHPNRPHLPSFRGVIALPSDDENAQKAAVDGVFKRLPKVFRTRSVRAEIASCVACCKGNYEEAALVSVIGVFTSIDRSLQSHSSRVEILALFRKKNLSRLVN